MCILHIVHLMSRSTLHKGDISSNVLENFTTYRKHMQHYSQQQIHYVSRVRSLYTSQMTHR